MKKSIDGVSHLDELSAALERAKADPADICIAGTAVLALLGIKDNPDLDFIAAEPSRSRLLEFIRRDPNSRDIPGVRAEIGDHLELLIKDRLTEPPYLFGLSDAEVVNNGRYHLEEGGFKFLRPEIILSMKGAKRRAKDIRDIHLMQDSSILDSDWWDWDLVFVVPPWKRTFATRRGMSGLLPRPTIIHRFLESTRDVGLVETVRRGSWIVRSRAGRALGDGAAIGEPLSLRLPGPLSNDLEHHYPLPNLVARQYDEAGNLVWIHDESLAVDYTDPPHRSDRKASWEVCVDEDGLMVSGHGAVRDRMDDWRADLPAGAPNKTFRVGVLRGSRRRESLADADPTGPYVVLTGAEKLDLLKGSAACFFAILWPSLQDHFDRVTRLVGAEFEILEVQNIELGGQWGLERFIKTVYSRDERTEEWFVRNRINHLSDYEPKIRILTLEVPNPRFTEKGGHLIVEDVYENKMEFRREIGGWLEDYTYGTCLHMTDNFHHNAHIADLVAKVLEDRRTDDRASA